MIEEIKDKFVGRCRRCGKKYICDEEDIIEQLDGYYLICPDCGTDIRVFLKEE